MEWRIRKLLNEAIQHIAAVEDSLSERQATRVSEIHPALRNVQDEPSSWRPFSFLLPYDYPLATLKTKAPDQWLILRLNAALSESLREQNVSLRTRCTIVAVLLECLGVGRVEPITLETYLRRRSGSQSS